MGRSEVLHGIDITIEQGGITALLGANGAGKTTTLRALCRDGAARGRNPFCAVSPMLGRRATEESCAFGIAHVPEGRGTFVDLTVEELRLGTEANMGQITTLISGLSLKQRFSIVVAALLVVAGVVGFVHWKHEGDFRPLYTSWRLKTRPEWSRS